MLLILVRNISFELRCAVSKMDEQVVFQENKLIFTLVGQLWDTGYRQQFRPISISAGRHRRKRTHRICWNQRRNGLLPSDVILLRPRREREREKKRSLVCAAEGFYESTFIRRYFVWKSVPKRGIPRARAMPDSRRVKFAATISCWSILDGLINVRP